jgi:Transposase DDE domain
MGGGARPRSSTACSVPGRLSGAVEVFEGSLHDDKTLPAQLEKLRRRFELRQLVVVADRGMVTKANLEALQALEGASWITALKAPQVQKLVADGELPLSLLTSRTRPRSPPRTTRASGL